MSVGRVLVEALTVFFVSLGVSVVVGLLWNLAAHRTGAIDWETSFRFAILLGIMVPWIGTRRGKGQ